MTLNLQRTKDDVCYESSQQNTKLPHNINYPASSLLHIAIWIVGALLFLPPVPRCMSVSLVAVQVGNMNYLAGRQCSAWETAVSMVRMDEERQERDETDSSSQPSSIHPSLSLTHPHSFCASLKILGLFAECRYKKITALLAKNRQKRKN